MRTYLPHERANAAFYMVFGTQPIEPYTEQDSQVSCEYAAYSFLATLHETHNYNPLRKRSRQYVRDLFEKTYPKQVLDNPKNID